MLILDDHLVRSGGGTGTSAEYLEMEKGSIGKFIRGPVRGSSTSHVAIQPHFSIGF